MSFSVSILATGSELLDGRVVDTNSNFVASELTALGLKLRRVTAVDDDLGEIVAGLSSLAEVSSIIITSGGLGPTSDDLTREAVAAFVGVGLFECPVALKHVEEVFVKRGRALDHTNRRQAMMPVGSRVIHNERGSAPGFVTPGPKGTVVCALSGVPREFQQMFLSTVLPLIKEQCGNVPLIQRATFKLLGVPESSLAKVIESLRLPEDVGVSYRAAFPEVHLVLKSARADLASFADQVRSALGAGNVYAEDAEMPFVAALQSALELKQLTIATAESCTGGMAAELLTRTPGSSRVFRGSVVAYQNDIKERQLGVPASTLAEHGAVSAETVRAMAQGVRDLLKSDIGLAISGVAGPDGGSEAKPVGTFFVGISSALASFELRCHYTNERQNVRVYASYIALDLARRHVLGLPLPASYPIWLPAVAA